MADKKQFFGIIFIGILFGLAIVNMLGFWWTLLVSVSLVAIGFIKARNIAEGGHSSMYSEAKT